MTTTYPIAANYADGDVLSAADVNQIAGGVNDIAALQINAQTGTTYTLVIGDAAKIITLSNAAAITLTVPAASSVNFAIGTQILLYQGGAGQVSVSPTTGTTPAVRAQGSKYKLSGQYAVGCLTKIAADEWVFFGNTAA
jgi:hypothetical protein